ncbi:sulfatase-like hydrolase/transferase [Sphingobacterium sp. E70]|uniref:sulfatase-like hydrolase/transferase n=1 Tax=Sphingobacterium sp. E70 TaxID=2853439 RepID=UPI00211D0CC1|nr:sulfatase-like hydrolase/transferase [Sphingobacterium sp. E70]ULT25439.1 sulfatase-like hydrolase/transferase [Sphingobacterium sp. E70]
MATSATSVCRNGRSRGSEHWKGAADIKRTKKDKNTIIIFLSDNGAQGGERNRIYTSRNTETVGLPGSYDIQNSSWSQTGNSPLRSYKDNPYEGVLVHHLLSGIPKKLKPML